MAWLRRLIGGLNALFRKERVEQLLDEELHAFLEASVEQKMQAGMRREEATRAARVETGSLEAVKDHTRDVGWETEVESVWQDVRYAVRTLRRSAGFATAAILTLALGLGASTAIFSVVDAVVIRALPFDEHDRLVAVGAGRQSGVPRSTMVTVPAQSTPAVSSIAPQDFLDWRERQDVFTGLAAFSPANVTLIEAGGQPEELRALRTSWEFFDVLRVAPALGRAFVPENETDGQHRVALISHGLWQARFGGRPDIVGRTIQVDDGNYEIAGITPAGFSYPIDADRATQIWIPLVIRADDRTRRPGQYSAYLRAVGRLKDDVSVGQATAQMNQIARTLEAEHPDWNKDRRVSILPLHEAIVGGATRSWMLLLLGAVTLVLLIVCANVASLTLARAGVRDREMAIRAAIGASRRRIARQLLIENLVLWVTAAAVGLVLARWGVALLSAAMPVSVPRVAAIALDVRVAAVAAAGAMGTGLLFGLVPALQLSRPNLTGTLKDGARGASACSGRQRARSGLVVVEISLAVILVVGAGLFVASFAKLMQVDLGFEPSRVLTVTVMPFRPDSVNEHRKWSALEQIHERVRGIPGVDGVAAISGTIPLTYSTSSTRISRPGRLRHDDDRVYTSSVTPEYHRILQIPLRSGRYLERMDREGSTPVVVINEAAAKKFFAGENPIGQSLNIQGEHQVVGVVGNVRQGGFEMEVAPAVYLVLGQGPPPSAGRNAQLVIRTIGDPLAVVPAIRAVVSTVLPREPVRDVRTLEDALAALTAQRRLSMMLLSMFGILGMSIAAVGVYGVMAYVVGQRTHEIGLRMALGATRGQVMRAFMWKAVALVVAGLAIGIAGASVLGSTASAFLFQIEPTDVGVFATSSLVLGASALAASVLPVRRAVSVDPMIALRQQ